MAIVAFVMAMTSVNAQRLVNFNVEAQYITDKMVAELGLSKIQRNSILQLNLSYLGGINSYRDIDSRIWRQRNNSLRSIMTAAQWRMFKNASYFYRPIGWRNGAYVHNIYNKYPQPCPPRYDKPRHDKPHHDKPRYDKPRGDRQFEGRPGPPPPPDRKFDKGRGPRQDFGRPDGRRDHFKGRR